jgi:hypothetical protein
MQDEIEKMFVLMAILNTEIHRQDVRSPSFVRAFLMPAAGLEDRCCRRCSGGVGNETT